MYLDSINKQLVFLIVVLDYKTGIIT